VRDDIMAVLRMREPEIFTATINRPNLSFEVRPKPSQGVALQKAILDLITDPLGEQILSFLATQALAMLE